MISALLCGDCAQIQKEYETRGLKFTENSNCLFVKEGENVVAVCLFELDQKGITVLHLEPADDIALADFTLRSSLHIAAERCAMDARFADTAPVKLLRELGFVLDGEERKLDIDKLFKSCCGCAQE